MLDCQVHGARDLRVTEVPRPVAGPGEVLLRLGAAGICGSDMHYYLHGGVGAFRIREPLTPGHEASAVVAQVGPGVTRVVPGNRVAVNPSRPCGRCAGCREGRENLCANMRFLGSASVFPHVQGMFRDYFVMPESQCIPVPDSVSLEALAMAEPLSVALHSVRRGGELLGKRVLITGSGTIGCMAVLAARLAGAAEITVTDVVDHPLDVARQVGADRTVRADGVEAGQPLFAADDTFDVAFEVSGAAPSLPTCLQAVRRGGVVVQVGTLPAEGLHLMANLVMQKELDLRGSFRFGAVFEMAVAAIADGRVDVRPVLSGTHPLEHAREAIELATDKTRSMKVQLVASAAA